MNTFLKLAKKVPWWGYVAAVVFIIIVWQQMSSWALSSKLYNMALDNLRTDQSQALQERDEQLRLTRDQNIILKQQVKEVQKEKEVMKQKAIQSEAKVAKLEGENNALRKKIDSIVVSNDPDRITDDLNKMGYGPIERVR